MAAAMDRTYAVSVRGVHRNTVLYDKLLKLGIHEQFIDIADRAGGELIKDKDYVLSVVKASKDEVSYQTVDKHESAGILVDLQYRHIVFVYNEILPDRDDDSSTSRPQKNAFTVLMQASASSMSKRVLPRQKTSSSGMTSGISNFDKMFNSLIRMLQDRGLYFLTENEGNFIVQVCLSCM